MIKRVIRVHRRDSAFVYAILESLDGMAAFSTVDADDGANHLQYRDIQLLIPEAFVELIDLVIEGFRKKFSVIELDPSDKLGGEVKDAK